MSELLTLLFFFGLIFYCFWMAKPNAFKPAGEMSRKKISFICLPVLLILFIFVGMNTPVSEEKNTTETVISEPVYKIISDENFGTEKRTVDVLLDERVSEQQLEKLANKIQKMNSEKFKRTFIMYRIQGEKSIAAWATTHFDPDLKIDFIGLDAENYKTLINKNRQVDGKKIGEWYSTGGYEHVVVIFKKDGQYFENNYFVDGSANPVPKKLKFDNGKYIYPDTDENWHFVVNDAGDLEYWGENGNSTTAKKIN